MEPFEIRYLSIKWLDSETVAQLETSQDALPLSRSDLDWRVETTTFPTLGHYIGICTRTPAEHTPYLIRDNGKHEPLIPIKQPGSKNIWWIQNSGWDKDKNRYLSELYRTAGRATLKVQRQTLIIENSPINFSLSEIEHYLTDFKGQLWMLILDESSALQANVTKPTNFTFDNEAFTLYHNFIQAITAITRKPSMVLMETQGKVPRRHVRPVNRTFREYAIRPNAKLLTSRIYRESYDTAENRYIHYCVQRLAFLIRGMTDLSHTLYQSYTRRLKQEEDELATFKAQRVKIIDEEVFDNEIETIKTQIETEKRQLDKINEQLSALCYSNEEEGGEQYNGSYTIKIGSSYGNDTRSYFCPYLNKKSFKKSFENKHNTYLVVRFPKSLSNHEYSLLHNNYVTITGTISKYEDRNASGNIFYCLTFITIDSIYADEEQLQKMKELLRNRYRRRAELVANDWQASFSHQEKSERKNEILIMNKSIEHHKQLCHKLDHYQHNLPIVQSQLNKLQRFFTHNGVQIRAYCPNSMIFVQNPSYAAAKSLFKQIINRNGLNAERLNALVEIDSIGLVNIANLYEKWCLLHIISALQHYRFLAEHNWQDKLITAVLQKKYDISIRFTAEQRQQEIVLTYEKILKSGKRPDFVLDLYTKNYELKNQQWEYTSAIHNRLVLDAKFRTTMTEAYLQSLVEKMYRTKNYSENGKNRVFILHPAAYSIDHRTSPLAWGHHCDYGQAILHDDVSTNDNTAKPHFQGSIFISPSLKHHYSHDNLQRLIGLFLQQHSEILKQPEQELNMPPSWYSCRCISCGNDDFNSYHIAYSPTKAGNVRWEITCMQCGLLTIQSLCYSCGTTLFKNSYKWTYHRTRSEQVSNVVCPECQSFL